MTKITALILTMFLLTNTTALCLMPRRTLASRMAGPNDAHFPLKFRNTLQDTNLYKRLMAINGNRPVHIAYIVGEYRNAATYFKEKSDNLTPDVLLMVYWDLWDSKSGIRHVGFGVDRVLQFRRYMALRVGRFLPFYMNELALLVSFREDYNKKVVSFDQVSLGKRETFDYALSAERLQGKGLMYKLFLNLEAFLHVRYPGWALHMIPEHQATKTFLQGFERLPKADMYQIPYPPAELQDTVWNPDGSAGDVLKDNVIKFIETEFETVGKARVQDVADFFKLDVLEVTVLVTELGYRVNGGVIDVARMSIVNKLWRMGISELCL